jgi:hypothetical protein
VLECVPGSLLGVALVYWIGDRKERRDETGLAGLPAD